MTTNPATRPARFPAGYGQTEETTAQLLAWEDVARRIADSPNYWLATTTRDGRPHLRPVDGVFVEAGFAFGGSPDARWVQHLLHRPTVSVSLPDDDHAVVMEGDVESVTDPALAISDVVVVANATKYPQYYSDGAEFRPFWMMRPRRVFAWTLTSFPARATRFDFDHQPDEQPDEQ